MRPLTRLCFIVALFIACAIPAPAQSNRPDDVYLVGNTLFAYYKNKDKTEVSARNTIALFDNTRSGFSFVHGAQHVDLFPSYEFIGTKMTEEPTAVTLAFESRSSVERLNDPASRVFQLTADGRTIITASLTLDKTTLIGYVTWQQTSARVPMADFIKFLTAKESASVRLGGIIHSFSADEFASLKDFTVAIFRAYKGQ